MRLLIAAALLALHVQGFSQPATPLAPASARADTSPPLAQSTRESEEVSILRAQLEQMRRSEDRLIQVLVGSMGFVGAMALVLIAFNIWNAKTMHDRDVGAIKKELTDYIHESMQEDLRTQGHKINTLFVEAEQKIGERARTEALEVAIAFLRANLDSRSGPMAKAVMRMAEQVYELAGRRTPHKQDALAKYYETAAAVDEVDKVWLQEILNAIPLADLRRLDGRLRLGLEHLVGRRF